MVELGVQGSSHSLLGCKLLEDRDSSSMCLQPAHGAWGQALVTAQDEVSVDLFFFFFCLTEFHPSRVLVLLVISELGIVSTGVGRR